MANKYLSEQQESELLNSLTEAGNTPEGQQSPEAMPPVEDNAGAAPVDAGAPAPAADPNAAALGELGFTSVEDLIAGYKDIAGKSSEYKEMLSNMLAYQQAVDNQQEIDPTDPMASVKKAVREEMGGVYEKLQRDAKNKMVQDAWLNDSKNLPGLMDVMPEITEYISKHPELSVENDGMRRAYEAVRSSKYRSEDEMFGDAEFVKRAASNDKVKNAVISEYLAESARNGDNVPVSIGGGGNVPLTGQKAAPSSMDQAKKGLSKMLGLK